MSIQELTPDEISYLSIPNTAYLSDKYFKDIVIKLCYLSMPSDNIIAFYSHNGVLYAKTDKKVFRIS